MTQELRWAARYAFVEELWRGRPRVIADAELETVLREGGPGVAHGSDPALRELVDALLPHDPVDGEAVWMAVASASIAVELGRQRPGTMFVPSDAIADVLRRAHWDIAMVDLTAAVVGPPDGSADATTAPDVQDPAFGAGVYLRRALAAVRLFGLTGSTGRTVVISAPVREFPRVEEGLEYGELHDLALDTLGQPRLFGLFTPPMAAVVDFGEAGSEDETALAVDGDRTSAVGATGDRDDGTPLSYDNTLGSQEPALLEYIAVVGADAELPEGLTLIELPLTVTAQAEVADAGARAQLVAARRRADLAVIDRQQQLERVEDFERENAELRRELAARKVLVPDAPAAAPVEPEGALEAAQGREQELRWREAQLEAQLEEVLARPVSALEAELAELRARQAATSTGAQMGGAPRSIVAIPPIRSGSRHNGTGSDPAIVAVAAKMRGAKTAGRARDDASAKRIAARLQALIVRVERGGMSALALRRELSALRQELLG